MSISLPGFPCHLSYNQRFRYTLWRMWDDALPYVNFIGLNPSKADAKIPDQTLRRVVTFAQGWGFGAVCLTNLFAWRETDPRKMMEAGVVIGEENDQWLYLCAIQAGMVISAWGADGGHMGRDREVRRLLRPHVQLHHLGLTKEGFPKHPLRLAGSIMPTPWALCRCGEVAVVKLFGEEARPTYTHCPACRDQAEMARLKAPPLSLER